MHLVVVLPRSWQVYVLWNFQRGGTRPMKVSGLLPRLIGGGVSGQGDRIQPYAEFNIRPIV